MNDWAALRDLDDCLGPWLEQLAQEAGISVEAFEAGMDQLEAAGFVAIEQVGRRLCFRLRHPDEGAG